MQNNTEKRFIITRQQGTKVEFLMHIGHNHQFTTDRSLAMVYTKLDVAEKLAEQKGGQVIVAGPKD